MSSNHSPSSGMKDAASLGCCSVCLSLCRKAVKARFIASGKFAENKQISPCPLFPEHKDFQVMFALGISANSSQNEICSQGFRAAELSLLPASLLLKLTFNFISSGSVYSFLQSKSHIHSKPLFLIAKILSLLLFPKKTLLLS